MSEREIDTSVPDVPVPDPAVVNKVLKRVSRIDELKGKKDAANGKLSAEWGQAQDTDNLHLQALKKAYRYSKMASKNAEAELEALILYCRILGVGAQLRMDLFATAPAAAAPAPEIPIDAGDGLAEREPANQQDGKGGDAPESDFEEGSSYERGHRAGLAGSERAKNPENAVSDDAQQWDAGWMKGHQELVDKAAASDPLNVAPARRARGAAARAAAEAAMTEGVAVH